MFYYKSIPGIRFLYRFPYKGLICVLIFITLISCSNKNYNEQLNFLSFEDEENFWVDYSIKNPGKICGLEPFSFFMSKDEMKEMNEEIRHILGASNGAMIIITVNVSNGFFSVHGLTEDSLTEWNSGKRRNIAKKKYPVDKKLKMSLKNMNLSGKKDLFFSSDGCNCFDATSIYVTLFDGENYGKFSFYNLELSVVGLDPGVYAALILDRIKEEWDMKQDSNGKQSETDFYNLLNQKR